MATTTNYGWETPDDTDLVKDGALAQRTTANAIDSTLGTALNNKLHAGLVLIKTQTIGSGVTSVTVTNAFSATYDAYKIVISGGAGSVNGNLALGIGSATSNYKFSLWYATFGGSHTGATSSSATQFAYIGQTTTTGLNMNADLIAPYLTKQTIVNGSYIGLNEGGSFQGFLNDANSYTDFNIAPGSGTLTGGTIAVYGYAKD